MPGSMVQTNKREAPLTGLYDGFQKAINMTEPIVTIQDPATGAIAKIQTECGFNCFSWQVMRDGKLHESLWSHPDFASGNERPSGSGIPLLFPFPGRILEGKLSYGGDVFEIPPGDAFGNAIHGFVYNRAWRVVEQTESRVTGEFQASVDAPEVLEVWPGDFRIRVSYEVRGTELVSNIRYGNPGRQPLPCGFATHAYFRLPLDADGNVAETVVTAPVQRIWELNDVMLPTGNQIDLTEETNLNDGLALGDHEFDTAFELPVTSEESMNEVDYRTVLTDPKSGRQLIQEFDDTFTQCVVYTPPHREAICLEPYTCIPDAFRLQHELRHDEDSPNTGLQVLAPGESVETTITLRWE